MNKILAITIMAVSVNASADSIRTADGISCSFDSDDSPWTVETYAESVGGDYDSDYGDNYNISSSHDSKVGVKVSYKFGGPRRLNCDRLYQLELQEKEARVKQLEAKIKLMESAAKMEW